jgi:hypothetical protein
MCAKCLLYNDKRTIAQNLYQNYNYCFMIDLLYLLILTDNLTYHQVQYPEILHGYYIEFMCLVRILEQLFPYAVLTDWFLQPRLRVFTTRYGLNLYVKQITFRRKMVKRFCCM